jgi:hypothetical protein
VDISRPLQQVFAELPGSGTDPAAALEAAGYADLPGELITEAILSYAQAAPLEVAEHLAPFVVANGPIPPDVDASDVDAPDLDDPAALDEEMSADPFAGLELLAGADAVQDAAPDDEVPDDEVPDDEVPDDEVPNDEVPDDEVPDDEVPDDEVPDDEVPDGFGEEWVADDDAWHVDAPGDPAPWEVPDDDVPGLPADPEAEHIPGLPAIPDDDDPAGYLGVPGLPDAGLHAGDAGLHAGDAGQPGTDDWGHDA